MSKKVALLGDSSDSSDSEGEFKVNKNYADKYDEWRHKEEFQKLVDLGEDGSDSSSSESEVPEIEEEFLNTLSLLKSKDPKIYDKNITFFKEAGNDKVAVKKEKKKKPLFMKDYERKLLLENGGESEDEEHMPYEGPSYSEEQKELKESFKAALENSSDEEDDEDDSGLLQMRQKSKSEKESEEADYILWLKGQKAKVSEDTEKELSCLQKFWNDPKIDEGEKFLKDYILNKRYLDEKKSDEIPTYDQITEDIGTLSEDEELTEQQELFEQKYNFRFEEPDAEFIKRYPRTIGDSLRRTETKRKMKRDDYAERKRKEKEQRREDLKRLKAIKRKQIEEKFEKLKEVSGFGNLEMNDIDIESDFDPEKHDEKMKELFNEEYYEVEEIQKPEFDYDEELDGERWDQWTGAKDSTNKASTSEIINSSDSENDEVKFNPKMQFQNEMIQATLSGKKRKQKKSLFAKLLAKPKPVFDPQGKSFEEYLEEYYKLDYEDVVGDMPVRFKYRKVMPNNFGLTVDEILKADDKELNQWCSVKKTSQYRNEDEEKYDVHAFQKKAENFNAKKKILQSLFAEPKEEEDSSQTEEVKPGGYLKGKNEKNDIGKKRKRSGKNKIKHGKLGNVSDSNYKTNADQGNDNVEIKQDISQEIKSESEMFDSKKASAIDNTSIVSDNKSKKIKTEISTNENSDLIPSNNSNTDSIKKRKRKKKKKPKSDVTSIPQTLPQNKSIQNKQSVKSDNKFDISDARLKAYGINPKKFNKRKIY